MLEKSAAVISYFFVILFVGLYSRKYSKNTAEDYFLGSRNLGPILLFAPHLWVSLVAMVFYWVKFNFNGSYVLVINWQRPGEEKLNPDSMKIKG